MNIKWTQTRMTDEQIALETGRKAGEASKHHDHSLVRFHREWFTRFVGLHPEKRQELENLYRQGYREESGFNERG